jgi:ubiquinone/menaquinone biosynthesis C-methylase UbiE
VTAVSPDQVPEKWSDIASNYEQVFQPLSTQFATETLRLLALKPGERVIDVAAGTGAFSFQAARAGAEVLATDFAPGMVARLRQRIGEEGLGRITAEVMDGQNLDVADGSFDVSVSILGLMFFPDLAKGFSEMRRVVRPGGRVAVVCWGDVKNLTLFTSLMQAVKTVVPDFQPPPTPPVWARMAGSDALRDHMQQAGLRDVEITLSTASLSIESPETYWHDFTSSAPPLVFLFRQLGPERTAEVGRVYMESLSTGTGGPPALTAEVCIGIGRVYT